MALSPSHLLTSQDMEDFAQDYLGLSGIDSDLYYESYYKLNDNNDDQYDDEEYARSDELSQTHYQYWEARREQPSFFIETWQGDDLPLDL